MGGRVESGRDERQTFFCRLFFSSLLKDWRELLSWERISPVY